MLADAKTFYANRTPHGKGSKAGACQAALNGVLVVVEPRTLDGFGIVQSIRSMLLECSPSRATGEQWAEGGEAGGWYRA